MKIHDVRHGSGGDKNGFCGPSAISALTGMSSGEAARLLRYITGRRSIKGTGTGSVLRALRMCGIEIAARPVAVENYVNKKGYTKTRGIHSLTAWLRKTVKERTPGRVFLLVAGNHWQVISGRRYVCGQSGEIVSITDKKVKRRAKVTEAYECIVRTGVRIPTEAKGRPKVKSYFARAQAKAYNQFRKLVREHDLKYCIYDEGGCKYIKIEPTPFWPQGLDTMHYDFDTTLGRVQHCLEKPSAVEQGSYWE
jgi:hypothetical protein